MLSLPVALAQCTGPLDACDLPRTLPWYFGLAIAVVWVAAVIGAVLLVRRRWVARRDARRRRARREREPDGDRHETRKEIELW